MSRTLPETREREWNLSACECAAPFRSFKFLASLVALRGRSFHRLSEIRVCVRYFSLCICSDQTPGKKGLVWLTVQEGM